MMLVSGHFGIWIRLDVFWTAPGKMQLEVAIWSSYTQFRENQGNHHSALQAAQSFHIRKAQRSSVSLETLYLQ
jgi:hypothetical protein